MGEIAPSHVISQRMRQLGEAYFDFFKQETGSGNEMLKKTGVINKLILLGASLGFHVLRQYTYNTDIK